MDDALPFHRKCAAELFNRAWTLIEKQDRTPAETDEMIHSAHASRCHWGAVGEPANWIIGEWQISRVYSVLQRAEPALFHARRGLELCEEHQVKGFNLGYCQEAMARALALTAEPAYRDFLQSARSTAEEIADAEEKKLLLDDLATIGPPSLAN